jgi:transcriptional regulator with XRE-family HTH domain
VPRYRPDDQVKRRMWAALLRAAKRHHGAVADRGMVTQIAKDAGVSKAAVSDWKNQGNYPEASTLRRLADLYRVSAEELSGYAEEERGSAPYGPPDELLRISMDITEEMLGRLQPGASMREILGVARRAHDLFMQGLSEKEVKGTLYDELTKDDDDA